MKNMKHLKEGTYTYWVNKRSGTIQNLKKCLTRIVELREKKEKLNTISILRILS